MTGVVVAQRAIVTGGAGDIGREASSDGFTETGSGPGDEGNASDHDLAPVHDIVC